MKKYIFTVFAVAAVLSSCSKSLELNGDINSGAKAITTIGASTEISTRAVVSSSDNTKVNWESGDQLGVWGTNSPSEDNLEFTLDGDGGSTTGTFKNGSSSITTISAVMYPYQASASWDGTNSKLTCEIPPVQKAMAGIVSFDKAAAVMYSIGNTTNVKLNYAVNFLKVTVSETNVHAISISSSNALSGKMEITSTGVTAAPDGSLKGVTLIPATGDFIPTGAYYIAVKAGNIADPTISYVYYNDDHTATEKSKAGSGTLTFAEGTNVKSISVDFTKGTVTTRKAVQLWAEGPYFADRDVGASSATEVGSKMNYTVATAPDFTWGPNWCTPSKDQMDELLLAAQGNNSSEVTCDYCEYTTGDGKWGFKFTGKETGYTGNSVFFPALDGGSSDDGSAGYWSATADDVKAWDMNLGYGGGNWSSDWSSYNRDFTLITFSVRPVLKN